MRITRCSSDAFSSVFARNSYLWLFILTLGILSPESQAREKDIIHPLCFEPFASLEKATQSSGKKTINLDDCLNKYIKYPFKEPAPWQALFEKNDQPKDNNEIDLPTLSSYKFIGQMENQQVLMSYSANYGGSGTFSHAFLVDGISLQKQVPNNNTLTQTLFVEGGDRCFGSIEQLSIVSPQMFKVRRKMTPRALVGYGMGADYAERVTKGLSDCALCCIGSYEEQVDLKGNKELVNVILLPREMRETDTEQERCLNRLTKADTHTDIISKENLKTLQQNYIDRCL
ncbi:hypothetical protein [Endozoicomonas numazuensis]|uniref:Uncharacterized protein n=1 Tax=Endozoicomonas numazuensis TaxID=1137799 RepID=A0A081NIJ3_9GAMM|nr:hypothetical protein [Endozoicomonas numazuensis]KEQ18266.1 hypothetical protein GZ78_12130 [Endozoicomonas numazuensis]